MKELLSHNLSASLSGFPLVLKFLIFLGFLPPDGKMLLRAQVHGALSAFLLQKCTCMGMSSLCPHAWEIAGLDVKFPTENHFTLGIWGHCPIVSQLLMLLLWKPVDSWSFVACCFFLETPKMVQAAHFSEMSVMCASTGQLHPFVWAFNEPFQSGN